MVEVKQIESAVKQVLSQDGTVSAEKWNELHDLVAEFQKDFKELKPGDYDRLKSFLEL